MNIRQRLDRYFLDLEQQDLYSGVVLLTRGRQPLFAASYGYADRAWKTPNSLETRFDTASVTKLFTAVATLQCVDRGAFALDTPVVDFLGLRDTAISADVTVLHLLTHSSGIGDDCEEEDGEEYEDLWRTKPNYSVTETADFLPQFARKPANFEPGEGCRYCNCGFVLLGLMVEKASGMSYRDYVRRYVFSRAGMRHSDFFRLDRVNENVAEGADPIRDKEGNLVAWKRNIYAFPPVGSPDSGAHVTAADLERFLRAVQAGKLLSPALTGAFLTPQVPYRDWDGGTRQYGCGLVFYLNPVGEVVCYQKEGINAGVSAMLRYFPAQDIALVLLSNMVDGVWDPTWRVHELIVGGSG